MGIFSFIKGQFIDVIEWVDDSRDTLVWKFPDEDKEVKMGAQLTVREGQVAIFLNEGKLADVYQPGRHELVTRNMPILTSIRSWKTGFNSPFKVDVYYVNTRQFSGMRWGTPQPVMVSDPEFSLVPLRANGSFNFRVTDAAKFFREFVGTDAHVTTDELLEHFRGRVVSAFSNSLKKSGATLQEINANAGELGERLLPGLKPDFESLGLDLIQFMVESVTLPEHIQEELTQQDLEIRKTRRAGAAQNEVDIQRMMQEQMLQLQKMKAQAEMSQSVEDMQKFMQFQASLGMEKGGTGGANPSMMQNMMEMGMGMNMANQMMQGMNNPAAPKPPQPKEEGMTKEQIMAMLKELGELKNAGILTDEEFNAKKAELLAKL